MTLAPLFQDDDAGRIILSLVKDDLLPKIKTLQKFSIDVAKFRVGIINAFWKKDLYKLDSDYQTLNRDFLELYHHYSTPDLLFAGLNKENSEERTGKIMASYFGSQKALSEEFQEGFRFLEIIDRQMERRFQSASQIIATSISLISIAISISVAVLK